MNFYQPLVGETLPSCPIQCFLSRIVLILGLLDHIIAVQLFRVELKRVRDPKDYTVQFTHYIHILYMIYIWVEHKCMLHVCGMYGLFGWSEQVEKPKGTLCIW